MGSPDTLPSHPPSTLPPVFQRRPLPAKPSLLNVGSLLAEFCLGLDCEFWWGRYATYSLWYPQEGPRVALGAGIQAITDGLGPDAGGAGPLGTLAALPGLMDRFPRHGTFHVFPLFQLSCGFNDTPLRPVTSPHLFSLTVYFSGEAEPIRLYNQARALFLQTLIGSNYPRGAGRHGWGRACISAAAWVVGPVCSGWTLRPPATVLRG